MESRPKKYYHLHDFHSRSYIEHFFCTNSVFHDEVITFPMEKLHQLFEKGHINGDLLIDMSLGSFIHHLHSACDCFEEILLMRATDSCIFELRRWLHDRTGAFCWKHTSSFVAQKQGTSDLCEDKEMQLKNKISHVIKCDLGKENITDPVETPQADCIITAWLLDVISKDQNDYLSYLRNILKCMKPGGKLILIGALNESYFTINGERFHVFKYDKEFVCSALAREKLVIAECEVFQRTAESDTCDFEAIIYILAHKEK